MFDYDHVPHGLSVDYKYEYHQSQHVSRHHKGDVVDVICENLYKRTGMHGSKLDELAITRKVVERKDNPKRSDDQQHSTEQKPNSATNGAVAEQAEQAESASKSPPTLKKVKKVCLNCKTVGDSLVKCLAASNRPMFKRVKMTIPHRRVIRVSADQITKRWNDIREQHRTRNKLNDCSESCTTLWYEVNKVSKHL